MAAGVWCRWAHLLIRPPTSLFALSQFQLSVTIGIIVAQLVNYGTNTMDNGWRLSLGLAGVPGLILLIGSLVLPETPVSWCCRV